MSIRKGNRQRGVSLIELIVFIVVVSAAVAGVLAAFTASTRSSADPMIQKQALAIAEAFLEEVQLQPFTYCDPDDANAATALSAVVNIATDCAATVEASGPEVAQGESRYSATTPFDNVNDYNGYDSNADAPPGIKDIAQTAIANLGAYRVVVSVAGQPLNGIGNDANGNPQSLLITVTVTGPGNTTVVLHGYRVRYAPNTLP
jgi:MSHA pilin protein MshD